MSLILQLKFFREDQKASVAIIASAALLIMIGSAAVAVDISSFNYLKRKQQGATDIAALAASGSLDHAEKVVGENLRLNGYSADSVVRVEVGEYTADASKAVDDRFVPGATGANAVRVTLASSNSMLFGRVLTSLGNGSNIGRVDSATSSGSAQTGKVTLRTTSIAARVPSASFAIGSRLASLDGGVANAVLGSLLGAKVSLSVMDYEALVSANVDLFKFARALATRLSLQGMTYGELFSTRVRSGDALNATLDVLRAESGTSGRAAEALAKLVSASTDSRLLDLSRLINFGPYAKTVIAPDSPIPVELTGFDLVSALLQQAAGSHLLKSTLGVNVPGLAAVDLKVSIGERPVGTSFVRVGQTGASVHTAQTRLLVTARIGGGVLPAEIEIPVYVEVAPATARLNALACVRASVSSARLSLAVKAGVVDGWIGAVSDHEMTNFKSAPRPSVATLLTAPAFKVTGRAHATIANLSEVNIPFTHTDIVAKTRKQLSTTNFTSSLLSSLVGDLQVQVTALGLGLSLPGSGPLVSQTIAAAMTPIDGVLNGLLTTLGVRIGQADSWVTGVRCGTPALVR